MARIEYPRHPWRRNCLVVGVETIKVGGEHLPLSYSHQTVENLQATTMLFDQIAWATHFAGRGRPLNASEIQMAVDGARTNRQLTPFDLNDGRTPTEVFELIAIAVEVLAKSGDIIVTHNASDHLMPLLTAAETFLGRTFPPLNVVCTAGLERARFGQVWQRPGEPDAEYYKRISEVDGPLPELIDCYFSQEWTDGIMRTTDRFFPVVATHVIYLHHFGGRLLRPQFVSGGAPL
jgi:hypothetical protein